MQSTPSTPRHPAGPGELKRAFAQADLDRDGRIRLDEFARLLRALDADLSEQEIRIGFHELDTDRDGSIDCQEFIDWWSSD